MTPFVIRQVYRIIKFFRMPGRRKYLGKWWGYHRSTTIPGKVYERQIEIKYSPRLDRLRIRAVTGPTRGAGQLTYSGTMSGRRGVVRYIHMRDEASHERLTWYLLDPFQSPVTEALGLYLALDLSGVPAAGPLLISRTRRSIEDAATYLKGDVLRLVPLTYEVPDDQDAPHDT